MKRILFLDFDGVLHPDGIARFSRLGLLAEYLQKMPELKIVISSTWREDHTLQQLKNYFPAHLREQIIGVTPSLEDGYECGGRQQEILAYLESAGLGSDNCSWVALDDMQSFFDEGWPHLILTDAAQGFSRCNGDSLLDWYERAVRAG